MVIAIVRNAAGEVLRTGSEDVIDYLMAESDHSPLRDSGMNVLFERTFATGDYDQTTAFVVTAFVVFRKTFLVCLRGMDGNNIHSGPISVNNLDAALQLALRWCKE